MGTLLATETFKCASVPESLMTPKILIVQLQAAKFGLTHLDIPNNNPNDLIDAARTLKLLNAVREHTIGVPLTCSQYLYSSPEHVVRRLTMRGHYLMAVRVSEWLSMDVGMVLREWACAKIAKAKAAGGTGAEAGESSDDALCRAITEKLNSVGKSGKNVRFSEIARRSWEVGRPKLATKVRLWNEFVSYEVQPLIGNCSF